MIALVVATALGTLWTQPNACDDRHAAATATDLIAIDGRSVVARARASGDKRKLFDLPRDGYDGASIASASTDTVAVRRGLLLDGFDLATGTHRWLAPIGVIGISGDAIASALRRNDDIEVKLIDARSGSTRWKSTIDLPRTVLWVGVGTSHVYVLVQEAQDKRALVARWRDDGTHAWSLGVTGLGPPVVAGDDVVFGGPQLEIVDGATATATKLEVDAVGLVVHGDHAFASNGSGVVAIDVRNQRVEWSANLDHAHVTGATDGAVVAVDRDALRVLAPTTGKLVASYGVADRDVAMLDGGPLALACDGTALIAIDPSASDGIATITGRIRCTGCGRVPLSIAGVDTTTDARGGFSLAVAGHGAFRLRAKVASRVVDVTTVQLGDRRSIDVGTLDVEAPDGK